MNRLELGIDLRTPVPKSMGAILSYKIIFTLEVFPRLPIFRAVFVVLNFDRNPMSQNSVAAAVLRAFLD